MPPHNALVELPKSLKNVRLINGINADPCITNRDRHSISRQLVDSHPHGASIGKLNGVRKQIDQDLSQPHRIIHNCQVRLLSLHFQAQVFLFCARAYFFGSGSGTEILDAEDEGNEIKFRVLSSQFVQAIGGINWMTSGGFTLMAGAGWAWRTTNDPVSLIEGTPNTTQKDAFEVLLASGVVIELNVGYSF